MNNQNNKKSIIVSVIMLLLINTITDCQVVFSTKMKTDTDSLTLKDIIKIVVTTHPTIKVAEEAINNADARIGLAKTGYYPDADITASFANLGPVTKLTIPSFGTFQLYPENNYSAALNYRQVIYDFGRTRQNIEFENESKAIGEQALEQVKQRLSLFTVNNYYTLLFLQPAIKLKDEQLAAWIGHSIPVEKMMATGHAP